MTTLEFAIMFLQTLLTGLAGFAFGVVIGYLLAR